MNYYNYFTEIEEHFARRRGKNLLISPMDWGLIAAWKDAGIPLHVVLRGIDIAMDKFFAGRRRPGSKVNTLCYCHDSVMEEYANFQESRVGESTVKTMSDPQPAGSEVDARPSDAHAKKEILDYLSGIISEIKTLVAKQYNSGCTREGIARVVTRLEEIAENLESTASIDTEELERDLRIVDEVLVAELRSAIPQEQISEWEKEAKAELKVYRKRLPKEMYEKIFANFMRGKIHQRFNIGELTLFRL